MTGLVERDWRDGALVTRAPDGAERTWARPANLAEARLACLDAPGEVRLETGTDLLDAAFGVVPFAHVTPVWSFGPAVTPGAAAAFRLFAADGGDDFRVTRADPEAFVVSARRRGDVWTVGGFCAAGVTLTVRFEDLWLATPEPRRRFAYDVEVLRDPTGDETGPVTETLTGLAPDARICLDLAPSGGFLLEVRGRDEG